VTAPLIPVVDIKDAPVPFWALRAIMNQRRWLGRPDCVLVAWIHYPRLMVLPRPRQWEFVNVMVDGDDAALLPGANDWFWLTAGFAAGRHVIGIEPAGGEGMVEAVTLNLDRGTVVLVEVQPENCRWISRRPPSVRYRVLPAGFARNGRWGQWWTRRLGWDGPPPDPSDAAPELTKGLPPANEPPLVPEVDAGTGSVPLWARRAMWRARHDLAAPDCLLAARVKYLQPWTFTSTHEWSCVEFAFGADETALIDVSTVVWGFAAGLAAGSQTFEVRPWGGEGWVEPVTLQTQAGTVVLIEVRPRHNWWVSRRPPSVRIRVLPSALSGGGRWEARWRRRLGWEDLNVPVPPEGL